MDLTFFTIVFLLLASSSPSFGASSKDDKTWTKEDWEDFWNELESSEEEDLEKTWKEMDEIEPLTPRTTK